MPARAAFCREQAKIALEQAALLPEGDGIRAGLERAAHAFNHLAEIYEETGVAVLDSAMTEIGDTLHALVEHVGAMDSRLLRRFQRP